MAFLACGHPVRCRHRRLPIGGRKNIVSAVAIRAAGHSRKAEASDLPMEGIAVSPQRFFMAQSAFPDDFQLPSFPFHPGDLVSRVAIGADWHAGIARFPLHTMRAPQILGQNSSVTASAGGGNGRSINLRGRITFRQDIMRAVATGTIGRHQQSALGHRAPVDRVHVQLVGIGYRDAMAPGQFGIAVARSAGFGKIQMVDRRGGILHSLDLVGVSMTVLACGSLPISTPPGLSVNACKEIRRLICVAGFALGNFNRTVGGFTHIGVAASATQRPMHAVFKILGSNCDPRTLRVQIRQRVALQALLCNGRPRSEQRGPNQHRADCATHKTEETFSRPSGIAQVAAGARCNLDNSL